MAEGGKIATTDSSERTGLGEPNSPLPGGETPQRPTSSLSLVFRKLFSFNALLAFLLFGAVAGMVYLNIQHAVDAPASNDEYAIFEGDTWWHLAVGDHILATHTWPRTDSYSFTANGDKWIADEWLGEVLIAAANRRSGLAGMTILLLSLGAGIVLLMYDYAYLRSHNAKAAFVACALMLPLAAVSYTLRPQLLGYIFLLITLIWLEKFRHGSRKTLWLLPVLFLVWVNVHGSFAFGLAVLGLYWVSGLFDFRIGQIRSERWTEFQRRHLAIVTLLSLVALMITPYGTQLAEIPAEITFFQPVNVGSFQEWRSPDFTGTPGKLLLAMILLFMLIPLLVRVEYRLEELVLLLFGIYAACIHVRFMIVFAILLAPFLATLIARYAPSYEPSKDKPVLNAVLMGLICFGCVKLFPSRETLNKVVSHGFPTRAVEYIKHHPSVGPVFNREFWGGYLIKELGPQQKVFIDGRADLYEPAGVLSDYLGITRLAPNTNFLLRKYHVQSCLIRPGSSLAVFLNQSPRWNPVFSDGLSVLYVRGKRLVPDSNGRKRRQNSN